MSKNCSEILLNKKICPNPFILLEVMSDGHVAVCCPGRLKEGYKYVGNIQEHTLGEIWNGPALRAFRGIMYAGKAHTTCEPFCPQFTALGNGEVPPWYSALCTSELAREIEAEQTVLGTPFQAVSVSCDGACNLYCIMCRREKRPRPTARERRITERVFGELLGRIGQLRFLELTGNGDPFFSRETMGFLEKLAGKEVGHLTVRFITNGQLLDERCWEKIARIGLGSIRVSVSIDAATKESYEAIRRGGRWETLVRNMEMLARKRQEGALDYLQVSFVVMRRNIGEMVPFVALAKSWHCDRIEFQRIMYNFAGNENIFDLEEPRSLERLAAVLKDPVFQESGFLDVSSLLHYRNFQCSLEKLRSYRWRLIRHRARGALQRVAQGLGLGEAYRLLQEGSFFRTPERR